jgi:hypothetical protein
MTVLNILPECHADTKVVEIITRASEKYNHQHGCGQIASQLKNRLKDHVALGIIEEDKNKGLVAKYFLEFREIKLENSLILKRHNTKKQYLILICPAIEEWLLMNATSVDVDPANHNLPPNLEGFKHLTKIQNIDRNVGFYQFIKLLTKKEAPGIITLKNWTEAFINNTIEMIT